jgi:hypothetical protein
VLTAWPRKSPPVIEQCIERFYLNRQKLTGAALFEAVEHECRSAGLKAPSLNARAPARGGETGR